MKMTTTNSIFQPERGAFLNFDHLTLWVGNALQVRNPNLHLCSTCLLSREIMDVAINSFGCYSSLYSGCDVLLRSIRIPTFGLPGPGDRQSQSRFSRRRSESRKKE